MEVSSDSNAPRAEPKNIKGKDNAPLNRSSYREALKAPKEHRPRGTNKGASSGTEAAPATTKLLTLSSLGSKKGDADNKRTRSSAEQLSDQEQPANKRPPSSMNVAIVEAQTTIREARDLPTAVGWTSAVPSAVRAPDRHVTSAGKARNQEQEEAIQEEVRKSAQNVRWVKGPVPSNIDHWFYDLRNSGTEPPASLIAASRNMVLRWKKALGRSYFALREDAGGAVLRVEHAHRSFTAVTLNMPLSGWTSRACAKHQSLHDLMDIPKLISKDGNPLNTRPCPLIYYYEQLLQDMRHIVTHHFEIIPRTILNPIPKSTISSPPRNTRTAPPPNNSSSSTTDRYAWRQPKNSKGKKNVPSADEHFQELAKDIHEANKSIPNPYEHEDTEQYNWAFDSLLSDEKKDLIERSKRLIRLIKAGDPPKNYIERRASKLKEKPDALGYRSIDCNKNVQGFYGTTNKEYDTYAIFDLEEFIEDVVTNNADKHVVGFYEDRIGTYMNMHFHDGPSGQGSR
jgi:hypothetical protein